MVAAVWGAGHEAPVVVNLDGNPLPSEIAQLPGMDPGRAAADLDAFQHSRFGVPIRHIW